MKFSGEIVGFLVCVRVRAAFFIAFAKTLASYSFLSRMIPNRPLSCKGLVTEVLGVVTKVLGVVTEVLGVVTKVLGVITKVLGVVTEVRGVIITVLGLWDSNRFSNVFLARRCA